MCVCVCVCVHVRACGSACVCMSCKKVRQPCACKCYCAAGSKSGDFSQAVTCTLNERLYRGCKTEMPRYSLSLEIEVLVLPPTPTPMHRVLAMIQIHLLSWSAGKPLRTVSLDMGSVVNVSSCCSPLLQIDNIFTCRCYVS